MKRTLFFCGLLFFLSCKEKRNDIQTVLLPDAIELTSSAKSIDIDLLMPTEIFIKGNKLIVFENLSKDMFKVFDFPSLKYLYSFGDRGQGPNEFVSNGVKIINNDIDLVEIHDLDNVKFVHLLDTFAYIKNKLLIPRLHLKNPINGLGKINDSIYYFDNIFEGDEKKEFTRHNINSRERSYFSSYPNWVRNVETENDMQKYKIYKKSSNINFFDKKMVAFYYRFPAMKIIDFEGNVIKETHIKIQNQKFNIYDAKTTYFSSQSIVTNDYIYAMWLGKPNDEMMAEGDTFRPDILVFDWDGNVVSRYKLDKPITAFTLSEEAGKIYGVSPIGDSHINLIYEYDLPKIDDDKFTFSKIENSLYSLYLLEGYNFSSVSVEDGIDKIVEKNGLKTNINYFAQAAFDNGLTQYDLESIRISLCTSVNKIERNWADDFLNICDNWKDIKRRNININGLNVVQTTYFFDFLNPKNKIEQNYVCSYLFEIDNIFVEISVCSKKDNFSQYHSALRKMIHTFKLKYNTSLSSL